MTLDQLFIIKQIKESMEKSNQRLVIVTRQRDELVSEMESIARLTNESNILDCIASAIEKVRGES